MLKDVNFNVVYASGEREPLEFFFDALLESSSFDLGLGYFCSSAIRALAPGFAYFIANGGKVRILINDQLAVEDKNAIERGGILDVHKYEESILNNVKELSRSLSEENELFFKCLTFLIAYKRIEFVATISIKGGLAHDKYGVFTDKNGDRVGFVGSADFSMSALCYNAESISCFTSWSNGNDLKRLDYYKNLFEEAWCNKSPHVVQIPIEKVKTHIKNIYPSVSLQEILQASNYIREIGSPKKIKLPERIIEILDTIETEPRFPFPEERDIQKNAYDKWIESQRQGIFAMATGSGKTVTALNCVLRQYRENGFYKTIIVVPTQALAIQWEKEARLFNFQNIVSTHTEKDWRNILSRYSTRSIMEKKKNIVLITTYATFNRKDIQDFIKNTQGIDSFIYIADEAHNIGSANSLKHLPNNIMWRIGLSATPERIYDDNGSEALYQFFNSRPPSYTYRYTMKQAIDDGILCHYDYHPIFVELTQSEMDDYQRITLQLRKFIDSETGKYKKEAEMLLLKRKRIVHKAEDKKRAITDLLNEFKHRRKLDYTFVFVPEGFEPNYNECDSYEIDNEDIHIIDEYADMFKSQGYRYHKYISGLDDAPSILQGFANGDIQILLSMKCLDEGIDIPRAEHAIFCSSTGNPRQFVQRRGRVLRKCEDKDKAKIWDLIVSPPNVNQNSSDVERNMFVGEVKRIINFASLADNTIDILYGKLKQVCEDLGINLFEMLDQENEQYN